MDAGKEGVVERYLDLMRRQREAMFAELEGIGHEELWQRPAEKEWCVGETLDHLRVINGSLLKWFKVAWFLWQPWAKLRRHRPYQVEIDNVYERPNFPMSAGWIWPPKYTPKRPTTLATLEENLESLYRDLVAFYADKDPALLGHVVMYDPPIGRVNLIQGLRVNVYHDELHFNQIRETLALIRE